MRVCVCVIFPLFISWTKLKRSCSITYSNCLAMNLFEFHDILWHPPFHISKPNGVTKQTNFFFLSPANMKNAIYDMTIERVTIFLLSFHTFTDTFHNPMKKEMTHEPQWDTVFSPSSLTHLFAKKQNNSICKTLESNLFDLKCNPFGNLFRVAVL